MADFNDFGLIFQMKSTSLGLQFSFKVIKCSSLAAFTTFVQSLLKSEKKMFFNITEMFDLWNVHPCCEKNAKLIRSYQDFC